MLEAALDALVIRLDADRDAAVEGDRKRLRAAHAAEARGQGDGPRQRPMKSFSGDCGESFVGALQDALRADVDPGARRHLPVHRQPKGLEAPELVPRRPLRHEHRVGDEYPRRPFVSVENPNRLT